MMLWEKIYCIYIIESSCRKGRETREQMANIHWIIKKAREFQKNIHLCFIDYAKAFDCVHHNKLWKFLKEMGIPEHLTCQRIGVSASASVLPMNIQD